MPRSIWNGTITFGLVAGARSRSTPRRSPRPCTSTRSTPRTAAAIEHRRICPKDDKAVDYKDIVKGYEVSKGKWVELTDEEIAAAAGSQSKRLEIDHFVPAPEIDPDFYERTYYLGAGDKGKDAYALLHAALAKAERAGVGRWTFHNRERTVVIRTLEDVLALHTMRFADELVDPRDFDLPRVRKKPSAQEIKMATALVEGLSAEFDPTAYEDEYREAVLAVVKAKAEGKNIEPPADEEPESADDLLASLEASLAAA